MVCPFVGLDFALGFRECLFEVGDDVFDVFDAHGEADVVIGDAGALALFR